MFSLGKGFPPSVGRGRVPQRALAQLPALESRPPPPSCQLPLPVSVRGLPESSSAGLDSQEINNGEA